MGVMADLPCASYMALYIITVHVLHTNSRTSHHWKLNQASGKVEVAALAAAGGEGSEGQDPLMTMLTSRMELMQNGEWKLEAAPVSQDDLSCYESCQRPSSNTAENATTTPHTNSNTSSKSRLAENTNTSSNRGKPTVVKETPPRPAERTKRPRAGVLDCGKPVSLTDYDHLEGIITRSSHPHIPEPEVAIIFKTKGSPEVDMNQLEVQLKKAKKDQPHSSQVYNQIGNFWRIKGDTQRSIECFRKALFHSPNNSDVLLNLARVLFNLQFLDDAFELTRRSLDVQSPDQNSWLQHFTLGEILKARGHFKDATHHFRHTLDLHPGFHPALAHLREIEVSPDGTVTYYTLFIILLLVLGVLCGILTSIDGNFEDLNDTVKTQRHFNRAMAMRSIKLGINPKLIRMRKQYAC